MRKSFQALGKLAAMACVALLVVCATGHAGKMESFSADQVMLEPGGKVKHASKIYAAPQKMRMEMPAPDGRSEKMIVIVRQDRKLHWMVNPAGKVYLERPLDEQEMAQLTQSMIDAREEKILGKETVNGYPCTQKEVVTRMKVMGQTREIRSVVWVSDRFEMPLRTRSQDGTVTELRNIREEMPPDALFEPPADYRKVDNMMEWMEAGGKGAGKASKGSAPQSEGQSPQLPFKLPKGFKLPAGD